MSTEKCDNGFYAYREYHTILNPFNFKKIEKHAQSKIYYINRKTRLCLFSISTILLAASLPVLFFTINYPHENILFKIIILLILGFAEENIRKHSQNYIIRKFAKNSEIKKNNN